MPETDEERQGRYDFIRWDDRFYRRYPEWEREDKGHVWGEVAAWHLNQACEIVRRFDEAGIIIKDYVHEFSTGKVTAHLDSADHFAKMGGSQMFVTKPGQWFALAVVTDEYGEPQPLIEFSPVGSRDEAIGQVRMLAQREAQGGFYLLYADLYQVEEDGFGKIQTSIGPCPNDITQPHVYSGDPDSFGPW